MGASMSAPTPINRVAGKIAYEFLGISPAAAGVAPSAAAADHAHAMGKTISQVSGFGYALQLHPHELLGNSDGVVTTAKHLPSLTTWTIDVWQNTDASSQGFIGAFIDSTPGDALSQPDAFTGYAGFLQECSSNPADYFAVNNNASTLLMPAHTNAWHLFSMQCDGHQTTCFIDGVVAGTLPAFSVPAACWGIDSTQTAQCVGNSPPLDEFRVSNIARYNPAGFTPPTAPFEPDAETLVLWHFDDAPFAGTFFSESDGNWTLYNGAGDFFFQDSSGNNNVGYLADHVGNNYLVTMTAALAGITAHDAVRYGYVNSIQGKTGPMQITDTAGNSIATPVPVAGSATQLQLAVARWLGAWSSTTAYAVGDMVTESGITYVCIANNTNNVPPNTTYWEVLGGGGGTLAHTYEQEITVTTPTTALTYTPTTSGLYRISFYFRVVTAATDVTVTVTTTDATGAQTWDVLPLTSEAVGSYQLDSITVGATAGDAIDVVVTAGTANQVYVSSSIEAG